MISPTDCVGFLSRLDGHLAGDLPEPAATWAVEHVRLCPSCRDAAAGANEAEAQLARWSAPEPPKSLRERILRAARAEHSPRLVTCEDLRAELDEWLVGDSPSERGSSLERHAERCAPCALEVRVARRVDALLAGWPAPAPSLDLKQRLLDRHVRAERSSQLARSGQLSGSAGPYRSDQSEVVDGAPALSISRRVGLAAAAAVLVMSLFTLLELREDHGLGHPDDRPTAAPPLEQIDADARDVQDRAVAFHQYPASVGRFSGGPPLADRVRRASGNAFHRSLRRVLASSAETKGER